MFREKIIRNVEMVNSKIPREKIFFLPAISASRPKGSRNIAEDSIKLLITHPRLIAFAFRSLPIDGRARFTAEPRKGVRKAAKVETRSIEFLKLFSCDRSTFIAVVFYKTDLVPSLKISKFICFFISRSGIPGPPNTGSFFLLGINDYCNRSIINQFYLHHCTKFSGANFSPKEQGKPFDKAVVQWNSY